MLEELNSNIVMAEPKKHRLSIHHLNLFNPKPIAITNSVILTTSGLLALTKEYPDKSKDEKKRQVVNLIEVYNVFLKRPKLYLSLIDYEQITGLAWINDSVLLTVSKQQSICLYNIKTGIKIFSTLTDYGAITCMKYSMKDNLLITGTEYGYAIAYTIERRGDDTYSVETMNKMVKVNGKIQSIDFAIKPKLQPATEEPKAKIKPPKPVKPGKRKRNDSSSESSDDDSSNEDEAPFLSKYEVTIFGAMGREVVVWDYHRKTVLETIRVGDNEKCCVNSIVALSNGDLITGDSTGTLNVFDNVSLTCKQSTNICAASILCVAKNYKEDSLVVSGKDPGVVIMHKDKTELNQFIFFERVELHTQDVTCLAFSFRRDFFSGSLDGTIGRFRLKSRGRKKLYKSLTSHNYSNHIKFSKEQMMMQYDRSLVIWKLPKLKSVEGGSESRIIEQLTPTKLLFLKTKEYIHSSTFSERWIAYSTRRGVHIFDRNEKKLLSYTTEVKLPNCDLVELCFKNNFIAVGQKNKIHLISLEKTDQDVSMNGDVVPERRNGEIGTFKFPVVAEYVYDSSIKQILDFKSLNKLVVSCYGSQNTIYSYSEASNSANTFDKCHKLFVDGYKFSFLTYSKGMKKDHGLYIYTYDDILIRSRIGASGEENHFDVCDFQRVEDLPEEADIKGMIILSRDQAILYSQDCMFKVDMKINRVVNENTGYKHIIQIDNSVFNSIHEVALVELSPNDSKEAQPPIKYRQKFGT